MSGPTARALELLSLLQARGPRTGPELAVRLGVSERTVRRDVERLRALGYAVDAEPGVEGGYRLAVGSHVPPLVVSDDEAIALVVGLRAAAVSVIEGIEDTSVALIAKLDRIIPERLRRRIDALQHSVDVVTWSPHAATVAAETLTVLSQGCRDREEVRFEYRRRDGEHSHRLVRPLQLVSAGRRWYLVAWDVRRGDWRTFRVDRMGAPTLAGLRFEPLALPADDAATFIKERLRSATVELSATVVVDAPVADAADIGRWFDARSEPLDDARTRMVLRAETPERLASMVAILAASFPVALDAGPPGLGELIGALAGRLGSIAPTPPEPE